MGRGAGGTMARLGLWFCVLREVRVDAFLSSDFPVTCLGT